MLKDTETKNNLFDKMEEYYATFGDAFPTMCFPTDSDEEWIKKIQTCIKQGQPAPIVFDLKYEEGRMY